MVDEIVFWLICAIAAAGVWWAFFGMRPTRHRGIFALSSSSRECPLRGCSERGYTARLGKPKNRLLN
jgi:hypothetical protein